MTSRTLSVLLLLPVFALAACGSKTKDVNAATYTCAQFNKSLQTKGDDSAGNFINQLVKKANLGQQDKTLERREITLGIVTACRNQPGSTKPAAKAVASAKLIKAGKFKLQGLKTKKKSAK
jgi:hypothetical protein